MAGRSAWQRVDRASSRVSTDTLRQMQELPWFASLSADERSWVGMVVQAGLQAFTDWLRDPERPPRPDTSIFSAAPRELTRVVSLKQTVQLVRMTVDVLEAAVPELALPGQEQVLREAVLRYSREVAFAAAEVYAVTAEVRGAWDARLEAGVVDALVRGQVNDLTTSRATALGWGRPTWVVALAAALPAGDAAPAEDLHHLARRTGLSLLVGEAQGGLLAVVGGDGGTDAALRVMVDALPAGPVVMGPAVADLAGAADTVAEAMAAAAAVSAWPEAPRPVTSTALLPERVVLGDALARARVLGEVYSPLAAAGGDLLATAQAYLAGSSSVEGAGRALFVHPNTVRYRLKKLSALLQLDLSSPRDVDLLRSALVLGRASPL